MKQDGLKILVIDNDPMFLKILSEYLLRDGHHVMSTDRAFRCLDLLENEDFDVVFVDLVMPLMGGDDLCRIIRTLPRHKETFLVIISAIALEQEIDFLSFGANACIAKGPFREMQQYLRDVIKESRQPNLQPITSEIRGGQGLYSRQITRELLQQNSHVRLIIENMTQGVIEIFGSRIAYLNRSALEILNLNAVDTLGKEVTEVLPHKLQEAVATKNQVEGSSAGSGKQQSILIHDRQLVVDNHVFGRDDGSRIVMLSDVTENKKLEAVIEAANLTENLGYVFSGIRHEIGNPVNSIKMALSVLQRNLEEYDQETIAEFLDRSLHEISRIEYLLTSLKNYSLFEKPFVEAIDLPEFLRNFIALVRGDFEQKKIQIRLIISTDALLVSADSRALHHVMLNILTNAAGALEKTELPQITVSCASQGNMVEIKIDDNGKGISESEYQHLFKPFFTSKTSGTGLGLVIVKKMLTAMKGQIHLESYKGLGTTVTICLPEYSDEPNT